VWGVSFHLEVEERSYLGNVARGIHGNRYAAIIKLVAVQIEKLEEKLAKVQDGIHLSSPNLWVQLEHAYDQARH
jgi:hypothetical protein